MVGTPAPSKGNPAILHAMRLMVIVPLRHVSGQTSWMRQCIDAQSIGRISPLKSISCYSRTAGVDRQESQSKQTWKLICLQKDCPTWTLPNLLHCCLNRQPNWGKNNRKNSIGPCPGRIQPVIRGTHDTNFCRKIGSLDKLAPNFYILGTPRCAPSEAHSPKPADNCDSEQIHAFNWLALMM